MLRVTRKTDPVLAGLVDEELKRQEHNIEMIASESTAPLAVMELTGSVFTNKTLEGYPGRRFQAGPTLRIRWRSWRVSGRKSCSEQTMPTYSRTPVLRPTTVCSLRC